VLLWRTTDSLSASPSRVRATARSALKIHRGDHHERAKDDALWRRLRHWELGDRLLDIFDNWVVKSVRISSMRPFKIVGCDLRPSAVM